MNTLDSPICRYCLEPILDKPAQTLSYWNNLPFVCHQKCKQFGEKQEALDCQIIDADCNDCQHFKRGQLEKRLLSCMKHGRAGVRWVNMGYFEGHCLKFNRPTIAQPNKWTGMECFEHRKL